MQDGYDDVGGPQEVDEFAMFRARSHGVESEYLEMARVRGRAGNESGSGGNVGGGHPRSSRPQQGEKQSSLDRPASCDQDQSPSTIRKRHVSGRLGHGQQRDGDDVTVDLQVRSVYSFGFIFISIAVIVSTL